MFVRICVRVVIERDKRLAVSHGNRSDFVLSDILYECSVLRIFFIALGFGGAKLVYVLP